MKWNYWQRHCNPNTVLCLLTTLSIPWSKAMSVFYKTTFYPISYTTFAVSNSVQYFFYETSKNPKDMAVVRPEIKKKPKQTSELRKKPQWSRKLGTLLFLETFDISKPSAQVQDTLVKCKKESITLQCRINWTAIDSISTWAFILLIFLRNWRSLEHPLRVSLNCFCLFH